MSREHAEIALREAIRDLDGLRYDTPAASKEERRRRSQLSRNICAEASLIYDNLSREQRARLRGSHEGAYPGELVRRHRESIEYVE